MGCKGIIDSLFKSLNFSQPITIVTILPSEAEVEPVWLRYELHRQLKIPNTCKPEGNSSGTVQPWLAGFFLLGISG